MLKTTNIAVWSSFIAVKNTTYRSLELRYRNSEFRHRCLEFRISPFGTLFSQFVIPVIAVRHSVIIVRNSSEERSSRKRTTLESPNLLASYPIKNGNHISVISVLSETRITIICKFRQMLFLLLLQSLLLWILPVFQEIWLSVHL